MRILYTMHLYLYLKQFELLFENYLNVCITFVYKCLINSFVIKIGNHVKTQNSN